MNTQDAPTRSEGDALYELHGRLVKVHHTLATAGPDDEDREADALEGLLGALRFIAEHPAFLASREAHMKDRAALR